MSETSDLKEPAEGVIQVLFAGLVVTIGWVKRTEPRQQGLLRSIRIVVIVHIPEVSARISAGGIVGIQMSGPG
jgi:hypothetical protein